jgi:hypothetical protein
MYQRATSVGQKLKRLSMPFQLFLLQILTNYYINNTYVYFINSSLYWLSFLIFILFRKLLLEQIA